MWSMERHATSAHTHVEVIRMVTPITGANYNVTKKKSQKVRQLHTLLWSDVNDYIYIYNKFSLEWSLNLDKNNNKYGRFAQPFPTINRIVEFCTDTLLIMMIQALLHRCDYRNQTKISSTPPYPPFLNKKVIKKKALGK
jgi:hypothetical protein